MPITGGSSSTPGDLITPSSQPVTTGHNFRQMVGKVQRWNPDAPVLMVQDWINEAYMRAVDFKLWYGLMMKGQIRVPDMYSTGTIAVTNGSADVVGTGTAFTADMVGRQLRSGYFTPIYTIKAYTDATHIQLDQPWGGDTQSAASFSIFQNLVSPGAYVKYVMSMINQRQGWRMRMNVPQAAVDQYDSWRTQVGFPWAVVSREPSAAGAPQVEIYPIPIQASVFPYVAYVQPPKLVNDDDYPYAFIRPDVIENGAIATALLFNKAGRYYDPAAAQRFEGLFQAELEKMARNDDNHYMRDLVWEFQRAPLCQFGADWAQSHDAD